jgi:hypothetical protein
MGRQSLRPLVDRLLGGSLTARLDAQRREGMSFEAMAESLKRDLNIVVTGETIRRWFVATDEQDGPEAA